MPRRPLVEARADFRGGRNVSVSPDLLNSDELLDCTNARISTSYGAFSKRTGSRRMHTTALGAPSPIKGVFQWDSPSGKQIVAVSNGRFYHKLTEFGEFTEVIPGVGDEFSTTQATLFVTFRAASSGAPLVLFMASEGKFYKWTGSVLTRIDGVNSAPTTRLLAAGFTRLFAVDTDFPKHGFWSRVGDGEQWATGSIIDGGSALVDVLTGDVMTAIVPLGSSVLFATEDSISRYAGYSTDDIQIAQHTQGVSSEIGVVGRLAWTTVEQIVAFLSGSGPFLAIEAGVDPIGLKVEEDFADIDRANLANAVVGYHHGRHEIWFAVANTGDGGLNKTVFVYNLRLRGWSGPFIYSFGITDLNRYEDANGDEFLIAGCSDGFVRHMDTGAQDDVLASGSGGSTYTMTVICSPLFFHAPFVDKALNEIAVQANLETTHALVVGASFDQEAFHTYNVIGDSGGAGTKSFWVPLHGQGKRLRLRFTDASSTVPIVSGFVITAWNLERT